MLLWPITMTRAYGISIACLFRAMPIVPLCFFDDLYDAIDIYVLPRHINWPHGLLASRNGDVRETTGVVEYDWKRNPHNVSRLVAAPVDCYGLGFTDGVRTATYQLQRIYGDSWRRYVPLSTMGTVFGHPLVDGYAKYWAQVDVGALNSPLYEACGQFTLVNVPLVGELGILAAVGVFVLLQLALVLFRSIVKFVGVSIRNV